MYIGVDIGGTKTLVATFDNSGGIAEETKFLTPKNYNEFLWELGKTIKNFKTQKFVAGGVGMPVSVFDRDKGRGISFGNLPWENVDIQQDIAEATSCKIVVENDAKMAALSEASLLKDKYSRVLYITISTGIGIGLVVDGKIDPNVGDAGGRAIMLEHNGKMTPWEDFAGGRALAEHYGKQASDINDETTWKEISHNLAKGFIHLIAIMQPDVIVIGGGVGAHFDKYGNLLSAEIEKYKIPLVKMPKLIRASHPDNAVIYGCFELAKQIPKA